MTTSLPRRGPSPFEPGVTTSQSRTSNISSTSQQVSRAKSRTESRKNTVDAESTESVNDKNTIALIRRVLCPDASIYGSSAPRPLQELLPPLTSSNDVDLQLYALIAVIIKEFVYSWYGKITPDHVFVDEVLQLIAHCTRALEQRLRRVDITQLILDEVTGLIQAHITAYRIAVRGSDLTSIKSSSREIYHKLNPHPGLDPVPDSLGASQCAEQEINEKLYRHLLAQGVLAVLLPTEDLENICLRTLVEDVLSDLILGNEVNGKICESWFIWTTISKVISLAKHRDSVSMMSTGQSAAEKKNRLEHFGLLSDDGFNHQPPRKPYSFTLSQWSWKLLYSIYLAYVTMQFIIGGLLHTAFSNAEASITDTTAADHHTILKTTNQPVPCRPVLSYKAFGLIAELVGISQRMPWLSGSLSLFQSLILTGPGKLGEAGSIVDRYLRGLIDTFVLTPTVLPALLFTVRTTLFPSNARLPRPESDVSQTAQRQQQEQAAHGAAKTVVSSSDVQDESTSAPTTKPGGSTPSPSEVAAIKRQCAADILSLLPASIVRALFSANTAERASEFATTGAENNHTNNRNSSEHKEINDQFSATTDNSSRGATAAIDIDDEERQRDDNDTEELIEAIENSLLDPFSDAYCNKHLIYAIIELVLVKLIPELSEHTISSLMEERGVDYKFEISDQED